MPSRIGCPDARGCSRRRDRRFRLLLAARRALGARGGDAVRLAERRADEWLARWSPGDLRRATRRRPRLPAASRAVPGQSLGAAFARCAAGGLALGGRIADALA